jgi:hypothetical protein
VKQVIYDDRARTQLVRAKILTDDFEIEGNVQVKQGIETGRVSDILNAPASTFIPVTQASCTSRGAKGSTPISTDCTIVQVRTIKMVFPYEDS